MNHAKINCRFRVLTAHEMDLIAGGTLSSEVIGGPEPFPQDDPTPSDNDPNPDGGSPSGGNGYYLPSYASAIAQSLASISWDSANVNASEAHLAAAGGYNGESVAAGGMAVLAHAGNATVYQSASGFFYADSDGDGAIDMGLTIDPRGVASADLYCDNYADVTVADF